MTLQEEFDQLVNKAADLNGPVLETLLGVPIVENQVVTPVTPVAVPTPEPKVAEPVVAPVATKPVIDLDAVIDSWDGTEPVQVAPAVQPVTISPDLSELAKALGKEDLKTKEDFVKVVNEYKAKAESVESLPADLAKAAEIAKLGGNYLEYLNVSVVDWSKEDPIVLYENYVTDQFTDPNTGVSDFEKIDKLLDKLEDDDKELRGRELQRQYIGIQAQQKGQIEYQARAQRAQFEASVKAVLDKMDSIGGFKITNSHKKELYDDIVSGKDLERNSLERRALNAFKAKYFDKIDSYRKSQIRSKTLGDILDEAQVAELKPSTSSAPAEPTKQYGFNDWISDLEKKKF